VSVLESLAGTAERYTGQALAFGLGLALANVLEPTAVDLRQQAWVKTGGGIKAVEAVICSQGVATGKIDAGDAAQWALEQGFGSSQFAAMVAVAKNGPPLGLAFAAWRRGELGDAEFETALDRAGLEEEWRDAVKALKENYLEPAEIAKAIHRGIMAGDGLLVVEPPTEPGNVPAVPPSSLDPVKEAAASGIDSERLRIMVGNAGLPPGVVFMLQMVNRGLIEPQDFLRGVGESNLRNEWGATMLEMKRRLLTPHDYVEARLRAWIDTAAMHAGAGLSGMTADDADILLKTTGRPLSWRQTWIAEQRGGSYDGPVDALTPAFLKSLEESNIRPEWYNLAWHLRFSYPSAFVIRSMAQAGELTQAETEQILLFSGWEPTLAKLASERWAGTGAAGGKGATVSELETEYEAGYMTEAQFRQSLSALGYTDAAADHIVALGDARRSKRYRETAVAAIHKAYTGFRISDATAESELASVNVTGQPAADLLALWGKERLYTITELTAAQVKKAYTDTIITQPAATQSLEWLHYTAADAATYLEE